jgi:hypothetical protein
MQTPSDTDSLRRELLNSTATARPPHTETGPLISTREVLKRYTVVDRTLDRWVADPKLGFPQPIIINKRRYFRENALLAWERQQAQARGGVA